MVIMYSEQATYAPGATQGCMDDTGTGYVSMFGTDGAWHTLHAIPGATREQAIAALRALRIECGAFVPVQEA